ncbi:hypothetical protein IJ384_03835 [bacterium]|nr:hypothetical protein [bacterium]
MINNITNVDTRMQQMSVAKTNTSHFSVATPPILSFKTPLIKEKATLRVKKFKRGDNIIIAGEIDDDYVDIVEEEIESHRSSNFFQSPKPKRKLKYLKNSYVIDYIQSPKVKCGLGTEALKGLAEKAFFDSKAEGRIVTFCAPVWKESSPAQFFYKLGFRFMDPNANEYIKDCIIQKIPDLPPQTGMMYLPKSNLQKLLRYGDVF